MSKILCGNNELDYRLRANGGDLEFGKPSQCVKKGYARGFNQHIKDESEFLKQWSGKYKAHVKKQLYERKKNPFLANAS